MAKRTDANQAEIVAGLREFGVSIWDTHECGRGAPDIVAGWHNRVWLFEVKAPGGKLNKLEFEWHQHWKGSVYIIHNLEEALDVITEEEW